jgi:hypothetical protein
MRISFRTQHIILMIGDDGIVIVSYGISGAGSFFIPNEEKLAVHEITEFINHYPQARITLLADNLTQDYRSDDLPRLNIFDRAKLSRRRLKQAFPTARLAASLRFKETPNRILMIGLHESNSIFAWADRLRARHPRIALLPVEGATMVAKLMPEAVNGWAMLVSRQKSGGFRQIVTFKNDLIFTRLTPLPSLDVIEDDSEIIARDIKASLDYLTRHGLSDPQKLSVLLLMPGDIHKTAAFKNLSLQSARSLSPAQTAQQLALLFAPTADDETADILFAAHFLNKLRPALSLMLPETRQIWLTQTLRRQGMGVACTALLLAVLGTIWRAGDFAATLYQTQKEYAQHVESRRALAQAQANAAPTTEPLGHMRQALERRHIYEQPVLMPWHGLNEMLGGLGQDSKITKLEWKTESDKAPEIFTVTLRVVGDEGTNDRATTVATFSRATQNIAHAMPDFSVEVIKPPYPALPQESVSAAAPVTEDPVGEISIQRKQP